MAEQVCAVQEAGRDRGFSLDLEECIYRDGRRGKEAREIEAVKKKVKCRYCGHEQNVQYVPDAVCRGVYIKCRARHCGKVFEIRINQDK